MEWVQGAVLDAKGMPLGGVEVQVLLAGSLTSAPAYADRHGVTPKASPFLNDDNGVWGAYLPTGLYDVAFAKDGHTFPEPAIPGLFIFDPITAAGYRAALDVDFFSLHGITGPSLSADGVHLVTTGTVRLKAQTTTYKNGWLEILGDDASASGGMYIGTATGALHRPFVITAEPLIFEVKLEKVGAGDATIRVGLASAALAAGDAADGFYIGQIDGGNAFLVVRSGGQDSDTVDLGATLASMKTIRVVAQNASIRAFIDNQPTDEVTASIPSAQMLGFSAASDSIDDAVGVALDYVQVWVPR